MIASSTAAKPIFASLSAKAAEARSRQSVGVIAQVRAQVGDEAAAEGVVLVAVADEDPWRRGHARVSHLLCLAALVSR